MNVNSAIRFSALVVGLGVGAFWVDSALARPEPVPGNPADTCCFTQTCPTGTPGVFQSATSCISACASNQVCSGSGGCNAGPNSDKPWATASCFAAP